VSTTAIDVGQAGELYEAAWNRTWALDSVKWFLEEQWPGGASRSPDVDSEHPAGVACHQHNALDRPENVRR
jgi:hypothetical protein